MAGTVLRAVDHVFALSGTVQSLGYQDRTTGYTPPAWLSLIANVHKHGAIRRPTMPRADSPRPERPTSANHQSGRPAAALFSLFAAMLGVLLAVSSALGIWIALLDRRNRRSGMLAVAAGVIIPAMLLLG